MNQNTAIRACATATCGFDVEALESRLVLSLSITVEGNTVRVMGDDAKQNMRILDQQSPTDISVLISVDANGDGDYADPDDIDQRDLGDVGRFDLRLRGGDDNVEFFMNRNYVGATRQLRVDLGQGNDRFEFSDAAGSSRLEGGALLDVDVFGSGGDDQVLLSVPGMRQGSRLDAYMNAGSGNDTVSVSQLNTARMQDRSRANLLVDTGVGNDQAKAWLAGDIAGDSDFSYRAWLGHGNDTFEEELDMESCDILGTASRIGVDVRGGTGDDAMAVRGPDFGSDLYTLNQGRIEINLAGESGRDRMEVLFGNLQLDHGTFRVRTSGGSGDDSSRVEMKTSPRSVGGILDIQAYGDSGNDAMAMTLNDQAGNSSYGPNRHALVDGGFGSDTSAIAGNGSVVVRRSEG